MTTELIEFKSKSKIDLEERIFTVIRSFLNSTSPVADQIDSYNEFINTGLQTVINQETKNLSYAYGDRKGSIIFGQIYTSPPQIVLSNRRTCRVYPCHARKMNLDYDTEISVDITDIEENGEIIEYHRVKIGRIPIMLYSDICLLSKLSEKERIEYGECPHDPGGYFIVDGNERVLVSQMRNRYNHIEVLPQKTIEKKSKKSSNQKFTIDRSIKPKLVAQMRSMSNETAHSALVQVYLFTDDRTISCSLPTISEYIPVGVVFKALGIPEEQFSDYIGIDHPTAFAFVRYIIRDSFFITSKEKALEYIAGFSKKPIDPTCKKEFGSQVIEKELFPHHGISRSVDDNMRMISRMVNKLISTHIGLRKCDDRDNYLNKRIETAGILLQEIWRNSIKKFIVYFRDNLEKRKQKPDIPSIVNKYKKIERGIKSCFSTGNWGVQKGTYMKTGVSQIREVLTYGAVLSHLRRILIPIGKEDKNVAMRQIHQSSVFSCCPSECFDPETSILLYDGTVKRAKDIVVNDVLIDDKGYPVRVKSTCSGVKNMYTISHSNFLFTDYTVTDNHILTLKATEHKKITKIDENNFSLNLFNDKLLCYYQIGFTTKEDALHFANDMVYDGVVDMSIDTYLNLSKYITSTLKMFKCGCVKWSEQKVDDPYNFGLSLNSQNKRIPKEYLINSQENRLLLFNGLFDSQNDSSSEKQIFKTDNEDLLFDIIFLLFSLGIYCRRTDTKTIVLTPQEKGVSDFRLIPKPKSMFVGWQLEGNGRFLLFDFTVTHNTPEGKKAGTVLNYSLSSRTTRRISPILVYEEIEKCKDFFSTIPPSQIKCHTPILLNGVIIGYTQDYESIIEFFKNRRDRKLIDSEVSIVYDIVDDEILIHSDEGRYIRPLFNIDQNNSLVFSQYTGKLSWKRMLSNNIVRYVDVSEIENAVIAMFPRELEQTAESFNFCEIHPMFMLGIIGSCIPFPDHSQSPRNCYQCLWVEENVIMANGEHKRICDIQIGDEVITINMETYKKETTKVVNQFVRKTDKQILKITTVSGRELVCTNDHQIYSDFEWVDAGDLSINSLIGVYSEESFDMSDDFEFVDMDKEQNDSNSDSDSDSDSKSDDSNSDSEGCYNPMGNIFFTKIKSIERVENVMIADITTESENHNFITGNGICVHNCSMGKQAQGIPTLQYRTRTYTHLYVLEYLQRPILSTIPSKELGFCDMPSGVNCIVAIMDYTGHNQEDSIIVNQTSLEKGMFTLTIRDCIEVCEEKKDAYSFEEIKFPPENSDSKVKIGEPNFYERKNANYSLLDATGVIRERNDMGGEMRVKKGDVLVAKVITNLTKSGEESYKDDSYVVSENEEGIIDKVHNMILPSGYRLIKIIIRKTRQPIMGDKFASRAAQKGTQGKSYRQEDMPYTASGLVPDVIINPCCIPSRMTINQLVECISSKAHVLEGTFGDATPFTSYSEDIPNQIVKIGETLNKYGYESLGNEVLYNGFKGNMICSGEIDDAVCKEPNCEYHPCFGKEGSRKAEYCQEHAPEGYIDIDDQENMIPAKIFMGPTYYQKLKHMVSDKMHARSTGAVSQLCRQPLEGRSKDGGLRFGEMERDCQISHGASEVLEERTAMVSDPFNVPLCRNCGVITSNNFNCHVCGGDKIDITVLPYAAKTFMQMQMALGLRLAMFPDI